MCRSITGFGSVGPHEVHARTDQGEQTVWVKRDLWFDRDDDQSWIVWAQHHAWNDEDLPAEVEDEGATLGSIVVTDRVVVAFLDQLGELLVNPDRFRHEPHFAAATVPTPSEDRTSPD
jgi:hypothetical protein